MRRPLSQTLALRLAVVLESLLLVGLVNLRLRNWVKRPACRYQFFFLLPNKAEKQGQQAPAVSPAGCAVLFVFVEGQRNNGSKRATVAPGDDL